MEQEILEILKDVRGDLDFTKETKLLTEEVLDSFDILSLLDAISERLQIEVEVEDITEENFNSYKAICRYLEKQKKGRRSEITEKDRKMEQELWGKERTLFDLKYPAEEVVRFLKKNFREPDTKTILDFACGSGRNIIPMSDMGFQNIIAMDYNQCCLELAKEKCAQKNIEYIQNERLEIPLMDESLDCIVAYGALFYFSEEERIAFAKEMHRILKPGGMVLADFRGLDDRFFGMGKEMEPNLFLLDERAGALQKMIYWFCNGRDLYQLYESCGFTITNMERKLQWMNNLKEKVDHYIVWLKKKS